MDNALNATPTIFPSFIADTDSDLSYIPTTPHTNEVVLNALLNIMQGPVGHKNPLGVSEKAFAVSVDYLSRQVALWDNMFEQKLGKALYNFAGLSLQEKAEAKNNPENTAGFVLYEKFQALISPPQPADIKRAMNGFDSRPIDTYAFVAAALHLYAKGAVQETMGTTYEETRKDVTQSARQIKKIDPTYCYYACPSILRTAKNGVLTQETLRMIPYVREVRKNLFAALEMLETNDQRPVEKTAPVVAAHRAEM